MDIIRSIDEFGNISYKNKIGQLHRVDGPALIWRDGSVFWYYNNKLHCTNGPAMSYAYNKRKVWCIHGKKYTDESEYLKVVRSIKLDTIINEDK